MKTIKVTIKGDFQVIDYASTTLYNEEENFNALFYMMFHWWRLEAMTIDDGEENVIKKKGKYVKTKEYLHDKFKADGDHPLPVECHTRTYYNQEISYYIELEDDEEFDIKKLQLVKSLETDTTVYPYLIVGEYILYDGKQIKVEEGAYDYNPEEKMYNEFIIDKLVDRDY